jgi:hypothetical protein
VISVYLLLDGKIGTEAEEKCVPFVFGFEQRFGCQWVERTWSSSLLRYSFGDSPV